MWVRATGQIECDAVGTNEGGCGARFGVDAVDPVPRAAVVYAARAHGWHCYQGPSITSKDLDLHVCPECRGTKRSLPSKSVPMPEDVPVLDEVGNLLLLDDY